MKSQLSTIFQLYEAQTFSQLELRNGSHQICVYLVEEWKTKFKTKKGFYE